MAVVANRHPFDEAGGTALQAELFPVQKHLAPFDRHFAESEWREFRAASSCRGNGALQQVTVVRLSVVTADAPEFRIREGDFRLDEFALAGSEGDGLCRQARQRKWPRRTPRR